MSRLAIHKGGSALTVRLHNKINCNNFQAMVIWPNSGSDIFIFSDDPFLCGCTPPDSDWLKYGYKYSYLLCHGSISTGVETFDLMSHLPHDLLFIGFGSAVDSSRMGEAALKMDLNSLRKGEALECEIMNSGDVLLRGKLFRSKTGELYVLHNDARGEGSTPKDENWRQVSGCTYSWCLLERDLRNDCKPETYKYKGPSVTIYNYDEPDRLTHATDAMRRAMGIINTGHNIGARVQVRITGAGSGGNLDGILIRQGDYYYVLHDNPSHQGEQPRKRLYSRDGFKLPYSWWIDTDPLRSTQIIMDSFVLLHSAPMTMTEVDPMNPIAKNVVGGVVEPPKTTDAAYDPRTFEKIVPKSTEPELIMFKKPTAKVTRCDVQPMQSPQIITKNKK